MLRKYVPAFLGFCVCIVAGFMLLGITGLLAVASIIVIFIIPGFLVMRNFLPEEEAVYFSLFSSLGLFPILVWLVNRLLPSFRTSSIIILLAVACAGVVIAYMRRK